ncbi:MAG: hypothetical protein ACLPGW_06095 [Roseiarcus sp.]
MTHSALTPLLGREFDDFLFASIGEDRNGTTLSVLSALARFDVDPWQETASLARMPKETATVRLAALIGATPMDLATGLSAATIAARLIALLPQAPSYKVPAPAALFKAAAVAPSRLFIALSVLTLLLAGYFIFVAHPSLGSGPNPAVTTSEASAPR